MQKDNVTPIKSKDLSLEGVKERLNHWRASKKRAKTFNQHSFHAIPVVDQQNQLVGMVSTDDMMTYLIQQY